MPGVVGEAGESDPGSGVAGEPELDVAALYQAKNELAHKLLAGQVAHKRGLLQKRRNFSGEVLLHGAKRVFGGVGTQKVGLPRFCT